MENNDLKIKTESISSFIRSFFDEYRTEFIYQNEDSLTILLNDT